MNMKFRVKPIEEIKSMLKLEDKEIIEWVSQFCGKEHEGEIITDEDSIYIGYIKAKDIKAKDGEGIFGLDEINIIEE